MLLNDLCGTKLAKEAMIPLKLKLHFNSQHSTLKDKITPFSSRLLNQQAKQVRLTSALSGNTFISDKFQEAMQ